MTLPNKTGVCLVSYEPAVKDMVTALKDISSVSLTANS